MTKIYCAFPGVGKTYFFKRSDKNVLDSDSSTFAKAHFPGNYIQHILDHMGLVDILLVSSHEEVRKALVANNIPFTLVYPSATLKEEYLDRYRERGNAASFVRLLNTNWDLWMQQMREQGDCDHIILGRGQYLSDVIDKTSDEVVLPNRNEEKKEALIDFMQCIIERVRNGEFSGMDASETRPMALKQWGNKREIVRDTSAPWTVDIRLTVKE